METNTLHLILTEEDFGKRADLAISEKCELSRNHIKQLIDKDCVILDDSILKKASMIVKKEHECLINIPENKHDVKEIDFKTELRVAYEDDWLMIINKPCNQLVHGSETSKEAGTVLDQIMLRKPNEFKGFRTLNGKPGIVNRLDKATSGLMIIAKTDSVHFDIQNQFANRMVRKIYLAKVQQSEEMSENFIIKSKIGPNQKNAKLMKSYEQSVLDQLPERYSDTQMKVESKMLDQETLQKFIKKESDVFFAQEKEFNFDQRIKKKSVYKYSLMECLKMHNVMACFPHTGRQHQIRVQLQACGSSIVGDEFYYGEKYYRLCLHSFYIEFNHPKLQKRICVYDLYSCFNF